MTVDTPMRYESDSLGPVAVPADRAWGAQTQRSLENFNVGEELMPLPLIRALAYIKLAAARVNAREGVIRIDQATAIEHAAWRIINGELDQEFPLHVWQTGSGTQTNMNVNEVIAHLATEELAAAESAGAPAQPATVHPNDHVNRCQSSNDVFPSALHLAVYEQVINHVVPAAELLITRLLQVEEAWPDVIKCGRTHAQDAVPLYFADEVSGWRGLIEEALVQLNCALPQLSVIALGGTAVGNGLNAWPGFAEAACAELSGLVGYTVTSASNKFASMSGKNALVAMHSALKTLAVSGLKLANDVRLLSSGPRNGLGEVIIPANEPGSSIMPGKVNPTQCEALSQVALQVMGNDVTVSMAASQGILELNVYMPLIGYNVLQSARLLGDVLHGFAEKCAAGLVPNTKRMQETLDQSIMMVTALTPRLGYARAAEVAHAAYESGRTLKEILVEAGDVSAEEADELLDPTRFVTRVK